MTVYISSVTCACGRDMLSAHELWTWGSLTCECGAIATIQQDGTGRAFVSWLGPFVDLDVAAEIRPGCR